jgi:hypothetical protein
LTEINRQDASDSKLELDAAVDVAVAKDEPKNKAAKLSVVSVMAENESLKRANQDQAELITELTHQLEEANKVLEDQEKSKFISNILSKSSFKIDDLVGRSAEELKSIMATLEVAMPPKVNSVRFGVQGAGLTDEQKGLTVGDISWPTVQRRKGAA